MFSRFTRGLALVQQSYAVLKHDKEIMLFPLISMILTIALFFSFMIPLFFMSDGAPIQHSSMYYLGLFGYYLISYFIVIFFNTGLITCAHIRLNGGDPTFSDGIRNAAKHIGRIFVWALISATVGIVLQMISERSNMLGKIAVALVGMAWSLLTFFVVPVMIFENVSVIQSIKQSGHLFKKTWGENVIGQFSMGFFFMILGLLGVIPIAAGIILKSGLLVLISLPFVVLYWVLLGIISSSLNGIFTTALYTYAKTGKAPKAFNDDFVRHAFAPVPTRISHGII